MSYSAPLSQLETSEIISQGPLSVKLDPPRGYWHGRAFRLSRYQAVALGLLLRAAPGETVTYDALEWHCSGAEASSRTITQLILKLRQKLPPGVTMGVDRGRGIVLHISEEQEMINKKMAEQAAALPDDVVAGVMVVMRGNGRMSIVSPGLHPSTCLKLMGDAVSSMATAQARSLVANHDDAAGGSADDAETVKA